MKFRKPADNPEIENTRDDVRPLAEALGLYRSAMHHVAEREAARRPFRQGFADAVPRRPLRLRLILAPALAAAVAAGVLVPLYSHSHPSQAPSVTVAGNTAPGPAEARANVDDTVLMDQIDSELSEEVPDALRPLAVLSDQSTTANTVSEKK